MRSSDGPQRQGFQKFLWCITNRQKCQGKIVCTAQECDVGNSNLPQGWKWLCAQLCQSSLQWKPLYTVTGHPGEVETLVLMLLNNGIQWDLWPHVPWWSLDNPLRWYGTFDIIAEREVICLLVSTPLISQVRNRGTVKQRPVEDHVVNVVYP